MGIRKRPIRSAKLASRSISGHSRRDSLDCASGGAKRKAGDISQAVRLTDRQIKEKHISRALSDWIRFMRNTDKRFLLIFGVPNAVGYGNIRAGMAYRDGLTSGVSDYIGLVPSADGQFNFFALELKRPEGIVSDPQSLFLWMVASAKGRPYVATSFEAAKEFIELYLGLKRNEVSDDGPQSCEGTESGACDTSAFVYHPSASHLDRLRVGSGEVGAPVTHPNIVPLYRDGRIVCGKPHSRSLLDASRQDEDKEDE